MQLISIDSYSSLNQHFEEHFSIVVADTHELLEKVFKIRYKVYCQELQYEPVENFPDEMERDLYDFQSIHCLLFHKPSQQYIACVRTILSDPQNLEEPFPFEKVCPHRVNFEQAPRSRFLEISRLAVVSEFRRRQGEKKSKEGLLFFENSESADNNKRRFPLIALSLYLACTSIGIKLGKDAALTLMESRLARHLKMMGIPSHQVGDFVDYHGQRGPFLLTRTEVLEGMSTQLRELYDTIDNKLSIPKYIL